MRCLRTTGFFAWLIATTFAATLFPRFANGEEAHRDDVDPKRSYAKELSQEFRHAAKQVAPSVVLVETLRGPRETPQWRLLEERRKYQQSGKRAPSPEFSPKPRDERGSGIIIDSSGVILTCHHVVAGADVIFVTLADGRRFEPVEVLLDSDRDISVLRIDVDEELPVANLGNSDGLEFGDWVVSIGNPYGLERSISTGTVAATDRITPMSSTPLIQSDASSNPGSSGGALVNLEGEVVGVLAGSIGVDDGFQGVGLAIPINTAKQLADSLLRKGTPERAYLGCDLQPISPILARQLELPKSGGLYVMYVAENTPAAKAKLRVGDLITHFDDESIDDQSPLRQVVEETAPGEPHRMTVFRKGHAEDVIIVMDHQPGRQVSSTGVQRDHKHDPPQEFCKRFGLCVDELTPDTAQQLGYESNTIGALITNVEIGKAAYKDGIAAGMVVLRVNDHEIRSKDDLVQVTKGLAYDKPVLMLIVSPDRRYLTVLGN